MPDPKRCLDLPFGPGDFRGALHQPLISFGVAYRAHDSVNRGIAPWFKVARCFGLDTMSEGEAAKWVRLKCRQRKAPAPCRSEWILAWEEAARAYRRPDGPVAWPYLRVSQVSTLANGLSFDIQLSEIMKYWKNTIGIDNAEIGCAFCDADVSAREHRFSDRRGGAALCAIVRPGDHIVFYDINRAARIVSDFASMLQDVWEPNNIRPHFLNAPGDPNNPSHKLSLHIQAAVAEHFSNQLSQKQKDVIKNLKRLDKPYNQFAPAGFKLVKNGGVAGFEPDHDQRRVMAKIEHYVDFEGLGWTQIQRRLLTLADAKSSPTVQRIGRHTTPSLIIKRFYKAWKGLVEDGQPRPPELQAIRDRHGLS